MNTEYHPLMKCGHRAHGKIMTRINGEPIQTMCCLACFPDPDSLITVSPDSLAGRVAVCKGCGQTCMSETLPPMFKYNAGQETDSYECPGCIAKGD
jgi:hypothetical protein